MKALLLAMTLLVLAGAAWFFFAEQLTVHEVALPEATAEQVPGSTRELPERFGSLEDQSDGRVRITGRVVLLGKDDERIEVGSGSLEVSHPMGLIHVPVEGGRFEFLLAAGSAFDIDTIRLRSVDCCPDQPFESFNAKEGLELELLVRERVATTLRVRDRVSGQELTSVVLLGPEQPSQIELLLENQTSPVLLPILDGKQTWQAGAKGYAPQSVEIDHCFGGEQVVLLEHEAKLIVQLVNRPRDENVQLRMKRTAVPDLTGISGPPLEFELRPDDPAEIAFGDLAAGTLRVTAARGSSSMEEGEYVVEEVELVAGEVSRLTLRLPDLKLPSVELATVTVTGTVEVPLAQVDASPYLKWSWGGEGAAPPLDHFITALEQTAPGGPLFSWKTRKLVPGPWRVEVSPFGHAEEFEIGFAGASGVRIIVPPLALIRFEVVDAETQAPLENVFVSLYRPSENSSAFDLGVAWSTEQPGILGAALVPGNLLMSVYAGGYKAQEVTLTTRSGEQSQRIELYRATTVDLVLMSETKFLRRDFNWWMSLYVCENLDGERQRLSCTFDSTSGMKTELPEPGIYRFTFAKIDGFLPIEPIEVHLKRGSNKVEVVLTRTQ